MSPARRKTSSPLHLNDHQQKLMAWIVKNESEKRVQLQSDALLCKLRKANKTFGR